MTIYNLVFTPDPRLRAKTAAVTQFDDPLQTLVDDMIETMYAANGVGLAATQIGIAKRIAVIDAEQNGAPPLCLINPEIVSREGQAELSEGCLSVPGVYDKAPRALKVRLKALDRHGKPYELDADGLLAHVIQHEVDHLNGKLFIDYLSPLKRKLSQRKVDKYIRRKK